jgi:peptide/nickel transport system substrate-binding protein
MKRSLSALWIICGLTLVGMTAPSFAGAPSQNELIIGTVQEFENLNPIVSSMSATTYILDMVSRRSLVTISPKLNRWVPILITEIPTFQNKRVRKVKFNGVDTIEVDWEIKKEAVWGDGTPITGHDFEFSIATGLSPNVSTGEKEQYRQFVKIVVDSKNPKKFTTTYDKPKWDFHQLGTVYLVPKHLEEPVMKKYGGTKEGYDKNTVYATNPLNPGLYSGPYRVSDIKLGSHVELVQNEKWWGPKKPYFKKIVIKLIPNTQTLEANLLSGTIHMTNSLGMGFEQAVEFDKKVKAEKLPYRVEFKQSQTFEHMDFNLDVPGLNDISVRKAIAHAIDRKGMIKSLFENKQTLAHHFIAPGDPWYTEDPKYVVKYEYSPRLAERLLEGAGWKKGGDGIRAKDGKRLSFLFQTTAGNRARENIQALIKDQLSKVGIELTIKNEPPRVFFAETMQKRNFQIGMYAWFSSIENNPRSTTSAASIPSKENGWSGQNYPGWNSAEQNRLIVALDSEYDPAKRKDMVGQMIKQYTSDIPVLCLFYRSNTWTVPANFTGMPMPQSQFSEGYYVEEWRLK